MLSGLLITLDILVCIALIAIVLMQRSEGGAFGVGGGPTGLITARGAGDLLTRTTWILFALFLGISLSLTLLGAREHTSASVIQSLKLAPPTNSASQLPSAPAPAPAGGPLQAPAPTASLLPTTVPTLPSAARPNTEAPPAPILEAPAPKPAPGGQH
jgi:preprotein translocase subunit SecG